MGCRDKLRALARVLDTLVGGKVLLWRQGDTVKLFAETHSLQLRGEATNCIEIRDDKYYLVDTSQLRTALRGAPRKAKLVAEDGEARIGDKVVGTVGARPRIRSVATKYTGYAVVEPKGFRELVEALDTDSVIIGYTLADTFAIGALWLHSPRLETQGPYLFDHVSLVNGLVQPMVRGSAKLTVISKYYALALGMMEELSLHPPDDMLYPLKAIGRVAGARLEAYIAPAVLSDPEKKQIVELYTRGALTDHVAAPAQLFLPGSWAARLAEALTPMTWLYLRPGEQVLVQPVMGDTVVVADLSGFKALLAGSTPREAYELFPPSTQAARLARLLRTVSLKLGERAAYFWDEEIGTPIDPENPEGLLEVAGKAVANASAGSPEPVIILSRESVKTIVFETRYAPRGAEVTLAPIEGKRMCYASVHVEDQGRKTRVAELPLPESLCRSRIRTRLQVIRVAALLDTSVKVYMGNGYIVARIGGEAYAVTRQ